MGIAEVLTILFAVLKCTGVIAAVFYVGMFVLLKVADKWVEEERTATDEELEKKFGRTIDELNKKTPEKVANKFREYDSYYGTCPCCYRTVADDKDFDACKKCGQALDWRD